MRCAWDTDATLDTIRHRCSQLGLLDAEALPVAGIETARKVLDPMLPSNTLMARHPAGATGAMPRPAT